MVDKGIPYCGLPATPADLWMRWNLDPFLIVIAVGLLSAYLWRARITQLPRCYVVAFVAGWSIALAALISPLCPLSVALFSARVSQHMIMTLMAAPLLAVGMPYVFFRGVRGLDGVLDHARTSPILAAGIFAVALWLWHAPAPYELTFRSSAVYWLMHTTLIGSAVYLWYALLCCPRARVFQSIVAGVLTTVQMGFIGALITLAPHALYMTHQATTAPWGWTPLHDQQLGGIIMWVPGCSVFLIAAVAGLSRLLAAPSPTMRWA